MVCKAKINSLQYLRDKNIINDVNKILNLPAFDKANLELTRYAEAKYGLPTEGRLLFSKKEAGQTDAARSRYWRDANYTITFAESNDLLFNTLDELIKYYDSRDTSGSEAQFYQLDDPTVLEKNIEELDNFLLDFLKQFHVEAQEFDNLKKKLGIDALGVTDVLNKLIWYNKNRNVETVPEEVGHMLVMLMGPEHKAIKELRRNITSWDEYNAVYQQYMPIYNNVEQVKLEAIGKVIAKSLVANYKAVGLDKSLIHNVLKAIERLILKMLNNFSFFQTMNYNARVADHIALNVLAGNANYVANITENRPVLEYQKALENNDHAQMIIDIFAKKLNFPLTGSLAIAGQGEIVYRASEEPIHDLDFVVDGTEIKNLEALEDKLEELNAVPIHFGWTNPEKDYTTYAYYIPKSGYTVEVLERSKSGWAVRESVILRDEKGNVVPQTSENIMPVDFFTYTDVKPSENNIGIFSSWTDIYKGKLSLSSLGKQEVMFRRPKDQKDYVNSNPINDTVKPASNFIYYQLPIKQDSNSYYKGVAELFDSNPELANAVYEALGFNQETNLQDTWINYVIKKDNISKEEVLQRLETYKPKMITVYRGEGSIVNLENSNIPDHIKKSKGRWFTKDKKVAQQYAEMQKGSLYALQIPETLFDNISKELNLQNTNGVEALLPQELVNEKVKLSTQITPQQKQQAQQLYSQYLDSIFPDSKVKDIVYHGVTKGREAYNNILQNGFLTINKSNWSNNKDKEFKGVFFTDVSTATSYGVNLERELRPEEKDFVIPAVLNVETLLTPKMGLVSGTVTKLRNENSDIQNLGIQGEEGSEGVHENTVVFEPEQIHILGSKQDIEGFEEFVNKETKTTKTLIEEFDPIKAIEVMELDVPSMQKARAKEMLDVISERLALGLQVSYHNISPEEATEILKNRPIPYTGQPAFYHAGVIYTVGENVSLSDALHEFAHPLLGAIRRENKPLFNNLYNALAGTTEGMAIAKYVEKKYPELLVDSDLFKEEVMSYSLQLKSLNKINEQVATQGFDRFIALMLKAIKDILKKIFGEKAVIKKLDVDTTLEDLADMLLTKEFEYDTVMATKEDIVMYLKSVNEAAEKLSKTVSVKALQEGINRTYLLAEGIMQRAKNFKKGTPEYKMLEESIFMDINKNKLIPAVKKSLADFIDFGKTSKQSRQEIIDKALNAEERRIKDLKTRATSFVNSLDVMNESAKYMFENILEIQKNVGFVSRPSIALLSMYKVNNRAMAETIINLDKMFREDFGLGPGNPLYDLMSELTQNLIRNEELIKDIYKANTGKFYVEITGYMNEFLAEELNTNLKNALGKKMTEPEIQMLYNKVIAQELTDEDIDKLSKIPGVNMRYINQFIEKYNYFSINEDKILDILSGNTKDISVIDRYLKSYALSNDPIVGALSIWISDKKMEAQQEAIKKAHGLRVKLEKLLPKVNFNPLKTDQIFNMIATEDEVFDIDKTTGKPIRRKVGKLLAPQGNGWRYDLTELEYNLTQAKESGDKKAEQKAQEELDSFIADYMWDKYLPEVYEKDKIFDKHPMGRQAWLDRKMILEEMQNAISPVANELERFEKYSIMQALWKEYKQLYSLTYLDGQPKVDSPEDGIFDLTKAKILREHREATRDFNEFVPIEGSLQTAYNNFVVLLEGQDIERDSDEFKEKLAEWEKQNIMRIYSEDYYKDVAAAVKRIKELQTKMNSVIGQTIDTGVLFEEMYNLMFAFKDELGQPVPNELGEERLKKIRDTQQKIVDAKAKFDSKSGLTREEAKDLDFLKNAMRKQVALTDEQKIRYAKLQAKQEATGMTSSEIDELNDLYASLSDLRTTIPTDYYMEIMNNQLAEINAPEIEADKVDDFINSTEFAGILANDDVFSEWFYNNHIIKKKFDPNLGKNGKYVDKFERSPAWSIKIPTKPEHYKITTVKDKETGEPIEFIGVPNARHSVFRIKDKYRTIPIDADRSQYIGTIIDNNGDYLPRMYKPGDKYSAKTDKYMDKKYFALEAKKGAEWELLNAVKEYFLEIQKGKPGNSKLYLDIPRYSIKDNLEFMQSGLLKDKFDNTRTSLKYYFDRALGKAADDNENGFNYDKDNNLINTDLTGTELGFIPVTGLYRLDFDVTSKDVFSAMFQYAMSLETQSKLIETLPLVQSIVETVEDPANAPKILSGWDKTKKKMGELKRASSRDKKSQRAGQLRSLFEREYYGRKVVGLEENNIILSKVLNGLQKLSATSSLALNPSSDLKNRYGAIAQNIVEAAGGEFVDLKSLAIGRLKAASAMLDWSAKGIYAKGPQSLSTQMIMAFDPAFKTEDSFGKNTSVTRSMAKDLLNGSFLYDFRKFAEMEGALQLFFGFMDKRLIDVTLSNGKTAKMKYIDAWELGQDGYIKLKDGINPEWSNQPIYHIYQEGETLAQIAKRYYTTEEAIKKKNKIESLSKLEPGAEIIIATAEKFKRFRNEFAGTSHLLYGAYDAFAQPEGDQYMIYRMFFFMRKWATPMFVNKWGAEVDTSEGIAKMKIREQYNWEIGKTRMGYYTKTLQTIYELVRSKGDKYNHMTDSEKVALKKTFADTVQMIVYALLVSMLFGYDSDDDERWEKIKARSGPLGTPEFKGYGFLANHTMLLLLGIQSETSAFLPLPKIGNVQFGLDDYSKFFTQTSTAFGNTITLYAKIFQDIFNTVLGDESAYYKRDAGPYWFKEKGVNKIWSHLFKTVGFTGGTGDPETLLKNLEQSGTKIG